jgi:energy-coupling factor transport system ATP-binding protein
MAWVEIKGFSYTYPGETTPALKDINLDIPQHAFIVIAGRSGSGKSTLGKALSGFLFHDEQPEYEGKIIVNQTDMTSIPLFNASKRVAYVQQNPEDQFCTLTVLDEIAFALENACLPPEVIEERIDQALAVVKGLDLKDRLLSTLSGGEKQKIAIASMLALGPDVLILDEPTSNLDPDATQHVFETLHGVRAQKNLTVIIIEHKLAQLMAFDPTFVYMDQGRIVPQNPLNDIPPIHFSTPTNRHALHQTDPIVEISHLHVNLNRHPILEDINLSLYPGEFVALMGPNGSGKSTLLHTIMGFHKPERGSLVAFGKDRGQFKTSVLVNHVGFIFQNPDHQLFTQSVWDEATLTVKNLGLLDEPTEETTRAYLSDIGLADRLGDHPQRLSYGEKRRLNLVAVMLHNPQLLLIDEFLIGQDLPNAHQWMQLLKQYTLNGHTILLVNHHADLTQAYCDRVIFLDHGKKILDQPTTAAFTALGEKGFPAFLPRLQEGCVNA